VQPRQLGVVDTIAIAAPQARRVVVAKRVAGPRAGRQLGQPQRLVGADMRRRQPLDPHQREIEHQL
jgi:hypothetical protein